MKRPFLRASEHHAPICGARLDTGKRCQRAPEEGDLAGKCYEHSAQTLSLPLAAAPVDDDVERAAIREEPTR